MYRVLVLVFTIRNSQISQKLPILHLLVTELQSNVPTSLPLRNGECLH